MFLFILKWWQIGSKLNLILVYITKSTKSWKSNIMTQKHLKEAKTGLRLNLISCSLLYVDVQNIVSFISEIYLPQVHPHRKTSGRSINRFVAVTLAVCKCSGHTVAIACEELTVQMLHPCQRQLRLINCAVWPLLLCGKHRDMWGERTAFWPRAQSKAGAQMA